MKADRIRHLLPAVVQEGAYPGTPMAALLDLMEALHRPSDEVIESIGSYFNTLESPDAFVPFLARWVDLDRFFPEGYSGRHSDSPLGTGMGRLRELIGCAAYLSQWRGTRKGLTCFLETATGVAGFRIEERAETGETQGRSFHLAITAPADARQHLALIKRIIDQEKPAYVTYDLKIESDNPESR
jgi:phage tail-like protein